MSQKIVETLNPAQQQAVTAAEKHMLILAGAGSGKTKVLVHRIAWLIQEQAISPYNIFAVTFTNKAANEMRQRVESILKGATSGLWMGTFHGLGHRILRRHWMAADLVENFQIIDTDDQTRILRRIIKSLNIDEKKTPPKLALWFISQQKDQGLRAKDVNDRDDFSKRNLKLIYEKYEIQCQQSGLVDFAEILLRTHELLLNNPDILNHYQQRFQHILVDEFQDTNEIQYAFIHLLTGKDSSVMIVGDDDQSIYGWRGAKVDNLHQFCRDFPQTQTIRLEQNYRSTKTILGAANVLISHNSDRLGKELWTEGENGDPIIHYTAFNDIDEAHYVVKQIRQLLCEDFERSEFAILYRSNAQSRLLEEALLREGIPYRIYGGLRFFERAEIKDALAYMRLMVNRKDAAAFERIINTPTRGIGDKTLGIIRTHAANNHISLWHAAESLVADNGLSGRANNAVTEFIQLINQLEEKTNSLPLHEQVDAVIHDSGLYQHFKQEKSEKARSRVENIDELLNATRLFSLDSSSDLSPMAAFLAQAALEAGEERSGEESQCVQLMTLHAAKGLEFPVVFIVGLEEGLFPSFYADENPGGIEEERRLCYVGMTRAMKKLHITQAQMRRVHGKEHYHRPSRFLREIPKEYLVTQGGTQRVFHQGKTSFNTTKSTPSMATMESNGEFNLGQRVRHNHFGEGIVTNFEGQGAHSRVQVQFDNNDSKWLVAAFAKLESV